MPFEYTRISVFLSVAGLISAAFAVSPQCTGGSYQIIAKADCKGFYICDHGKPVEFSCPAATRFSATVNVCVHEGSALDDCKPDGVVPVTLKPVTTTNAGPLSIEERCKMFGGIIAHPTECQAYYNCSVRYQDVPVPGLLECSYPQLFNADTKQCEHFENVKCGTRKEFKDACDYRKNRCTGCTRAHCRPCDFHNCGLCVGKPDGLAAHAARLWSPYYVVCYKERTEHNTCPPDAGNRTQLFHPDLNQCVPLDRIPREHGGLMPECKTDGRFPDVFGQCDRYVHCKGGKYVGTVKCKVGEVFDVTRLHFTRTACILASKACGPCGKLKNC